MHLQCPFRILRSGKVLLGSDDMSWPQQPNVGPAEAMESFTTMYDRGAGRLKSALDSVALRVTRCFAGDAGFVTIELTESISIEIFPAVSGKVESWRLFTEGGEHYVYRGVLQQI
jgi:hypothetical protein